MPQVKLKCACKVEKKKYFAGVQEISDSELKHWFFQGLLKSKRAVIVKDKAIAPDPAKVKADAEAKAKADADAVAAAKAKEEAEELAKLEAEEKEKAEAEAKAKAKKAANK